MTPTSFTHVDLGTIVAHLEVAKTPSGVAWLPRASGILNLGDSRNKFIHFSDALEAVVVQELADKIGVRVRTQIVVLEPGLYLFRCASDFPEGQQIPASLQVAPVATGQVDFFPGAGVARSTLRKLGDCIVVRVSRDQGAVMIAKFIVPGQSAAEDVHIQIDLVDATGRFVRAAQTQQAATVGRGRGSDSSAIASAPAKGSKARLDSPRHEGVKKHLETIDIQGHVELQGDVSAIDGWLGDPTKSARIEGFAVHWYNQPEGVSLTYQCRVEGFGDSPVIPCGSFAGTRQRCLGITGVQFALAGPRASAYELLGQVCFATSKPQNIVSGERLSGPTETEHLCALRLLIARRQTGEATLPRSPSPWDDPSVTQIFRSQAMQSKQ